MPSAHDFNPATGLSREQYRDNWMSSGISNMNDLKGWLSQNGGQALADNGTVMTPYGDTLDMGTAFRTGQGTPGWTPVNSGGQANGSQYSGGGGNSVLGNAGSGNILQALMQIVQSQGPNPYQGDAHLMNTGAMPYDPHANNNPSMSNYFGGASPSQYRPNVYWGPNGGPSPTGQTDGTMLGTSFSSMNQAPMAQNNNMSQGMNQPSPDFQRTNGTGGLEKQQTPMGAPSFYQNRNESFANKPLPNNNLQGNF